MNTEEFNRLYVGNFQQDERTIKLYERLKVYYNSLEDDLQCVRDLSRKSCAQWLKDHGYDHLEVRRMREIVCKELGI